MRVYLRHVCTVLLVALLATVGCSEPKDAPPAAKDAPPAAVPVRPQVTAKRTYDVGEKIVLGLKWPASKWHLAEDQKGSFSRDGFWPFHVRINGREFQIRAGLAPFSGLASDWSLSNLFEDFEWLPGEYRVTYVLKGCRITHPASPESERELDEWTSNTVVFKVVAGESS